MPSQQLDLQRIAECLQKHGVDYVLVGGLAVFLQGGETTTSDVDLAFDTCEANMVRLADALEELSAKPKRWLTKGFRLSSSDLATSWLHLESDAGDIDLIKQTPGLAYSRLRESREEMSLAGVAIFVASPQILLELKRAAGRPKDLQHLEELEEILRIKGEQ